MKNIKTVFIIIGVIAAAIVAFSAIALVVAALQYVFLIGIIGLAGVAAYKFLKKPKSSPQIENKTPVSQLDDVDDTLEKYKQKYLPR